MLRNVTGQAQSAKIVPETFTWFVSMSIEEECAFIEMMRFLAGRGVWVFSRCN